MALYSLIVCVIVACISYIVYQKQYNVYSSIIVKPNKRYDYIVVGGGTTGCVLAARLSEDPNTSVLLIEAGDQMGYFTRIPLTATAAQLGPSDWSVRSSRQKYSSFGLWDQTQIIPRGKGLGGSGQINFLLHGFGLPEDYNRWSRLGFKGWTLNDLKPYFVKAFGTVNSEFDSNLSDLDSFCPVTKAPMQLKTIDEKNELMNVFRQASKLFHGNKALFRRATATIKDGMRHGTLQAYLKPAMKRKNLHVLLNTQGVSIRFDNRTATSLYILQNHRQLNNIFTNKEIILAAGAVKSPQILMLSGIGPRDVMRRLRINLVSANEHVGSNLHDHMNLAVYVSIKRPISVTLAKVFSFNTLWDYFRHSSGLLAFPPMAGVEYQNLSAVMLFTMGSSSERLLKDLSNYRSQVFRDTFPFYNDSSREGFMFLSTCVQPRSRGTVTLKETNTAVPPVVNPNYLHLFWDVKCMIQAIRRTEQLISSKPFQEIDARIHWPRPERCLSYWNYSVEVQTGVVRRKRKSQEKKQPKPEAPKSPPDEYLQCLLREVAVTGHHIGGTCAGGTVVDQKLRVKDVFGLRVMDASVLPSPLSLYPNSVLVAMAERAADLIRNSKPPIDIIV